MTATRPPLLLAALTALVLPVCSAHAERLSPEAAATLEGPDRQATLEACAAEEGSVTIYSSLIVDQALRPMVDAFGAKYPDVEVSYVRETGGGLMQKLMTEARARRPVASVIEATGIDDLAKQAGLIIPFTSPEADAYPDELKGEDWVASRMSYFGVAYNTDLVEEADLPDSYAGFGDPKWKGKLVWSSESTGAPLIITGILAHFGEDEGLEILKALAANQPASVAINQRQVVNQVMAGEYPASLDAFIHHPVISAAAGAPVGAHLAEPVIATNGSVLFPGNAPSPCAGMLLADFILSDAGQEILREANYFPASPNVPPVEALDPVLPQNAGVASVFLSPAALAAAQARSAEIYRDLFR